MGAAWDDPSAVHRRTRAARVERPSLWPRHPRRRWRKKCSARPRPLAGPGADAPASEPPRISRLLQVGQRGAAELDPVRANVLRRDEPVLIDAVAADADGVDESALPVERKPARKNRPSAVDRRTRAATAQWPFRRRKKCSARR